MSWSAMLLFKVIYVVFMKGPFFSQNRPNTVDKTLSQLWQINLLFFRLIIDEIDQSDHGVKFKEQL